MMQPLLQTAIRYRKDHKGLPKKGLVRLYADRLELLNPNGTLVENYAFTHIKRAAVADRVIVLLLTSKETVSLYFESVLVHTLRRSPGLGMAFRLLAVGIDRGGAVSNSAAWADQLEKFGVDMRRP